MADRMFEGEESMDHFIEKYCSENSTNQCKTITIGYIRNITKACDKFTKLTILEITNIIFAFYFGIKCTINLRYYEKLQTRLTDYYYTEYKITVPIEASLHDIWIEIQKKLNITDKQIRLPVFTLFTTSPRDYPDIIYFSNKHNFQFYSKPKYAKLFYHKINPIARWRSHTTHSDPPIARPHLGIFSYTSYNNTNNNHNFIGHPILCIENSEHDNNNTIAAQQWHKSTNFSTIYIDDYTQIGHTKEDKQYNKINNIGSSNINNTKLRKLILKVPRGISLETFYKIARQTRNISNQMEIRAFRLYANEKYLITFPYTFQLKEHKIMLEIGRYPKYTERIFMVCLINDENTTSKSVPLIIDSCQLIKILIQNILKLFNLNPLTYKKYICYNITYNKHEFWRNSSTLNSYEINRRNGDKIGIQIGPNKKILIYKDMRNLNEIWGVSIVELLVFGYIKNTYNQTPNEIQNVIFLFYGSLDTPYFIQEIGTITIESECNLEQLRKQIYNMKLFKNSNIKSHKYLLLSWIDNIYQIPLSFPMLQSGQLIEQQNFNSNKSRICVEILNEEIESIPKKTRFLHFHLAKINANTNQPIYWPNDYHIRVIYNERSQIHKDKITYKYLSQFFCSKYNILSEHLLIAMFKVNSGDWMLITDQNDNHNRGLVWAPYNIKKNNRYEQIFAIFDLSKCNINTENNKEKINFVKQNMNTWGPPPLPNIVCNRVAF